MKGYLGVALRVWPGICQSLGPSPPLTPRVLFPPYLTYTHTNTHQVKSNAHKPISQDVWGKAVWAWERPWLRKLRLTVGMANLSYRLPALLALVATQVTLLASQVSLPMLAPLLLGTGMLLRSLRANASFIFPRIGLMVVLLWALWFFQGVVQNTVAYLRKQVCVGMCVGAV